MSFSTGWLWLLGGAFGAFRNATAKKFYKSDFNGEFLGTEEDRKTEVPMTPLKRWGIVAACIVIAIIGIWLIQRDGNWNPFQGVGEIVPTVEH
jgi:hypothetical protein